jgi:hypothetical protein
MNIAPLVGIAAAAAQTAEDFQFSAGVITGYTGSEKALRIPAVLEGTQVTAIGEKVVADTGEVW